MSLLFFVLDCWLSLVAFKQEVVKVMAYKLKVVLFYLSGVFGPSVCSFLAERDYENHNSGILAWVTSFTGENTLGFIELNEFVFGANPRIDILHRVVVWQRARRRAVSELYFVCNYYNNYLIS